MRKPKPKKASLKTRASYGKYRKFKGKFPRRAGSRDFNDPQYVEWRKRVYCRDGYKCQWPGCRCHTKLNAHHIRKWASYPTLRYCVDNGITLCKKHHKSVERHEEDFAIMFIKILQDKITRKRKI